MKFKLFFQCTKNKTWKDIAAQLGIGASSSGAYTLKKHYGKNLLPFECHFDRGGMDPGPILAQVEAQIKKKSTKAMTMPQPPPVPSPGSQDSRDSYSNSSDPYCGYPTSGGGPISSHNSYPSSRSATTTPPGPNSDRPPSHPGRFNVSDHVWSFINYFRTKIFGYFFVVCQSMAKMRFSFNREN